MSCYYILKKTLKKNKKATLASFHSIQKKRKKSLDPVFFFNTILQKYTPALWNFSVQTLCFTEGKDLVLYVLPFKCEKTPRVKKKMLVLSISCTNPFSLQTYHYHSNKIITNPAICLKSPGWS